MTRVACCVCGRGCIPLADFEAPTCLGCADAVEAMLARAARGGAEHVHPDDLVLDRAAETYFGAAPAEVIERLLDDLFPARPTHRGVAA